MFNMFSSLSLDCGKKCFQKNSILWIGSRQCLDKLFKMSSRQKNKTKKVFKSFPDFKLWNTYKLKPFSKVEIDLLEISKMFWNPENSANKHFQRCHHFAFFFLLRGGLRRGWYLRFLRRPTTTTTTWQRQRVTILRIWFIKVCTKLLHQNLIFFLEFQRPWLNNPAKSKSSPQSAQLQIL